MLKKLRIKFIALNMATVALVLLVAFSAIVVIQHRLAVASVYETLNSVVTQAASQNNMGDLSMLERDALRNGATDLFGNGLSQNSNKDETDSDLNSSSEPNTNPDEGASPNTNPNDTPNANGNTDSNESSESDSSTQTPQNSQSTPPEIGGLQGGRTSQTPLAVYRISIFGDLVAVPEFTSASLSQSTLLEISVLLPTLSASNGSIESLGLYYAKTTQGLSTYIAFADMGSVNDWVHLALILGLVGLVILIIFFIVNLFFSKWALKPVQNAWETQKRFIADASHDLKTPLTVISANTSILLNHADESIQSQSQWLESTQAETKNMQDLVGDLLLLSRLDEGPKTNNRTKINFSEIVESQTLQFESVAFERNITLNSIFAPNLMICAEEARVNRLVSTLIDNACKYAGSGGCVTVSVEARGESAQLRVHNNGNPIPPEALPHIFERFYRGDKSRNLDENSHGLGLAIAKAIAEEIGGTLSATSSENEGTAFIALLPLAK